MNDQHITFSPERNQWTLTDGRHHMEVPEWAREIMRDEFERETRPLRDNLDLALDSKRIAERRVTGLLDENAKLREEFRKMDEWHSKELSAAMAENAKLREWCGELLHMAESNDPDFLHWPEIHDELRKLGVKIVKL